ncbi:MAG: hypothetical protein LC098_09630 [Burkholderiales bacterium]|nr:hypothetical protein [Burkholderiales bacterium]
MNPFDCVHRLGHDNAKSALAASRRACGRTVGAAVAAALWVGCAYAGGAGDAASRASTLPTAHAPTTIPASAFPSQRFAYLVYCDGRVDKLDLERRRKVTTIALSTRSGSPPAIAAAPSPGTRPDSCLARPAVGGASEGTTHLVASSQFTRDDRDVRKAYALLTFSLPDWTLVASRPLGTFDVLNGTPPRVVFDDAGAPRSLTGEAARLPLPSGFADYVDATQAVSARVYERSGTTDLLAFVDRRHPDQPQSGFARESERRFVPLAAPPNALSGDARLAPGGDFALRPVVTMQRRRDGTTRTVLSGELRLYDAKGDRVATLNAQSVAGACSCVLIAPNGVAVFVDHKGNYRFVSLGRSFSDAPVEDDLTDDLDGTRPGVVYASR